MKLFPFYFLLKTNIYLTTSKKSLHHSFFSFLTKKSTFYSLINIFEILKGLKKLYKFFKIIPITESILFISSNFIINEELKKFLEIYPYFIYSPSIKKGTIKNWYKIYNNYLIFNWLKILKSHNSKILIYVPNLKVLYNKLYLKYLSIKNLPNIAPSIVLFFTPFKDKQLINEINCLKKISIGLNSGNCDPESFTLQIPGSSSLESSKLLLSIILLARLY